MPEDINIQRTDDLTLEDFRELADATRNKEWTKKGRYLARALVGKVKSELKTTQMARLLPLKSCCYFARDKNGVIVGVVYARELTSKKSKEFDENAMFLEVEILATKYPLQGVGSILFKETIKYAAERGLGIGGGIMWPDDEGTAFLDTFGTHWIKDGSRGYLTPDDVRILSEE